MEEPLQRQVRIGATGAVGAVTLLWLGWLSPLFFPVGTVLMTVSLVPLAAGLRSRGGALLGLLFGILWIAARLGLTDDLNQALLMNRANFVALLGMIGIGLTASTFFNLPGSATPRAAAIESSPGSAMRGSLIHSRNRSAAQEQELLHEMMQRHKEWLAEWDRKETPWVSFDTHIRELLLKWAGANRIRCYHFGGDGRLCPLNAKDAGESMVRAMDGVLAHAMATGQRFVAASAANGPMLQQMAAEAAVPVAWAIPIRDQDKSIGLITVEAFEQDYPKTERLDLAADLIEQFWHHLHEADELRVARLTDPATGVLNRVEFLSVLNETVECSYELSEPVVLLALNVEGIRRLDDAGKWHQRNDAIELVGHVIRDRLRHDDMVGRFSDELFVAILRRLDLPLAELIARKLINAIEEPLGKMALEPPLAIRAGLAGSGWGHDSGQNLLTKSSDALKSARAERIQIGVMGPVPVTQEQPE
jgi:diguanylate cyclase (GGDEF)-like protein